ncbi:MAG: HlyD family efflux transporter periplasmic adaptor subunit [Eubacteriales bacterium]|jgi:hypothetical protein|nr:HlyD family efflux transporter periplasmic adaptor subunit [Eubacteriales bacterium]
MDFKYLKNIIVYIITSAISLFIIIYIIIQIIGGFGAKIETTAALYVTEREMITLDAYIIRRERVLYSGTGGSVAYNYVNGSKVGMGEVVASVYSGSDIREQIIDIDNKIVLLENSNITDAIAMADTASIDSRINYLYTLIREKTEEGDINYALRKKDELLTLLNRRQIVVKTVSGFNDRIESLKNQRSSITSGLDGPAESITTSVSGYFYNTVDGYETAFSNVDVDIMTLADFTDLTETEPFDITAAGRRGYAIGKIAEDYFWYTACEVDINALHNFISGKSYDIIYPYSGDKDIESVLYRIITEPNSDRVILIFKSGIITESFNFLRRQTVEIVQSSYSGYRVPVTAVRMIDDKKGVYVLSGSVVKFREIEPLFEKSGYLIVEEKDATNKNHINRLGLNEMIITKGKDYYDGQIIG